MKKIVQTSLECRIHFVCLSSRQMIVRVLSTIVTTSQVQAAELTRQLRAGLARPLGPFSLLDSLRASRSRLAADLVVLCRAI